MNNKFYTIEWFGPFYDIESLINWEEQYNNEFNFFFYIITGKPINKQNIRGYCGITMNKTGYIYKRYISDPNHIVHYLRDKEIWIGRFSEKKKYKREEIELCETMLISYWQPELNIRKKSYYPNECITIVNRWFKPSFEAREKCIYTAQTIPDLIIYDGKSIWGTDKIRKLKDL